MNKLGIRLHDLGKQSPYQLVHSAKHYGFDCVQLVMKKAFPYEDPFIYMETIKDAFQRMDIPLLGAYFNPVHPDKTVVKSGIDNFKKHLDISANLKAKYVGTETGSKMGSPWGYVKENHSLQTREELVDVLVELATYAESIDVEFAIEGAYAHVAYSPEILRNIIDMVNSENIKVIVDLYNYLNIDNFEDRNSILEECFQYLKDDIVIYHLKDFVIENNQLVQVGLGKGLMDFQHILNRIKQETPNAYLIFEGVKEIDLLTSLEHINSLL